MKHIFKALLFTTTLFLVGCASTEEEIVTDAIATHVEEAESAEPISPQGANDAKKPEMAFDGEIIIPDELSAELKEKISALPEDLQFMLTSEMPDDITAEYEVELAERLEELISMGPGERPEGDEGRARPEGEERP